MLVLTDKQVSDIEQFIQELPVKFGVPLINLFRKFAEEAASEQNKSIAADTKGGVENKLVSVPAEVEAE